MKRFFVLSLALVIPFILFSQNKYDANGKKHGYWKKHKEGVLVYEGKFIHGVPDSVFTYYYEDASVKARNRFYPGDSADFSYSVMYYKTKTEEELLMAQGQYHNKQKNGIWKYYNRDGVIVSIENWIDGIRHGEDKVFFSTGELCEHKYYENDKLVGKFTTYYKEGNIRYEVEYQNDVKSSMEFYYYKNSQVQVKGLYNNGLRHGNFYYYAENSLVQKIERYENGYMYEVEYIDKELEAEEMKWRENGDTEWDKNEPPFDIYNQY